jgi:hypothetical protein
MPLGFSYKNQIGFYCSLRSQERGKVVHFFSGTARKKMNNLSSFASEASNSAAFYDEFFFIRKPYKCL